MHLDLSYSVSMNTWFWDFSLVQFWCFYSGQPTITCGRAISNAVWTSEDQLNTCLPCPTIFFISFPTHLLHDSLWSISRWCPTCMSIAALVILVLHGHLNFLVKALGFILKSCTGHLHFLVFIGANSWVGNASGFILNTCTDHLMMLVLVYVYSRKQLKCQWCLHHIHAVAFNSLLCFITFIRISMKIWSEHEIHFLNPACSFRRRLSVVRSIWMLVVL